MVKIYVNIRKDKLNVETSGTYPEIIAEIFSATEDVLSDILKNSGLHDTSLLYNMYKTDAFLMLHKLEVLHKGLDSGEIVDDMDLDYDENEEDLEEDLEEE